ncbi:hypothetical protein ACFQI3_12485 [Hansschlegelia quercus]|uniref:hypothetical protein n=1 Tax=Hansschlegelia quercus TaxID=2528245 RepID=UPI00197A9F47|nr:hypothetical protein [Hansschlegelia quercus]
MAGRKSAPRRIPYADRNGRSGVLAYTLGAGFIDLWFQDGDDAPARTGGRGPRDLRQQARQDQLRAQDLNGAP